MFSTREIRIGVEDSRVSMAGIWDLENTELWIPFVDPWVSFKSGSNGHF